MRRTCFLCLFAALVSVGTLAQDKSKPNFTGTWVLDPLRSRFIKGAEPTSGTLTIDHQSPRIRLEVASVGASGTENNYVLDLTTDGVETTAEINGANCTATATWGSWTGKRLLVVTKCGGPDGSVTASRRLTLGSRGKLLTTVLTISDKSGTKKANEFYMRKAT